MVAIILLLITIPTVVIILLLQPEEEKAKDTDIEFPLFRKTMLEKEAEEIKNNIKAKLNRLNEAKVLHLSEKKSEKQGIVTPRKVIEELNETEDIKTVIYTIEQKDGTIVAGYSTEDSTRLIGMLEVAKQIIIEHTREGE